MKFSSLRSCLALVALLCAGIVGQGQGFTVTDLGTGTANDINSSGHAVGTTADAQAFFYNGAISQNIDIPLGHLSFGASHLSSQSITRPDSSAFPSDQETLSLAQEPPGQHRDRQTWCAL